MTPFVKYILFVSAVTFIVFVWDKIAAMRKAWRIPERSLLTMAFLGGSPAILLGEFLIGHKRRKKAFNVPFYTILTLQVIALIVWFIYFRH